MHAVIGLKLQPNWSEQSSMKHANVTEQTLTAEEEALARSLYEEFWQQHPTLKNPTDINMVEKANFLVLKGFENIRLMQKARKQAYDFTKRD